MRLIRQIVALTLVVGAALMARQADAAGLDRPIAEIRVAPGPTAAMQAMAPILAEKLADALGPRYSPGAEGGAVLTVRLTQLTLDDDDGGTGGGLVLPFLRDSGSDQLVGEVSVVGPGRRLIAAFPMRSNSGPIMRAKLRMAPDPRRLALMAHAFAYWTAGKI